MFKSCLSTPGEEDEHNGALDRVSLCCYASAGVEDRNLDLGLPDSETSLSFLCPGANLDTHLEGQQGAHWDLLQPWKTFGHPGNRQRSEEGGGGTKGIRYEWRSG